MPYVRHSNNETNKAMRIINHHARCDPVMLKDINEFEKKRSDFKKFVILKSSTYAMIINDNVIQR